MSGIAIKLESVSKFYKLFNSPGDRLKEALNPFGKSYHKDFFAIKSINLEIKKGEILGIVGKNGCGKSTLLKLISGVLTPNKGVVEVKGRISALLELGSGFNPEFTGVQNIFFYGAILGFSKSEMEEKLDDILLFADIGDFINQPLKVYSSGMKARLSFSVAVHIDPEILILDEVLSVGDVMFQRKCYARMQLFFESGKTIIFVSHNTNEINRLCTRAIFLLDGEIVMDGDPKVVTQYYEKYLFAKDKRLDIRKEINAHMFGRGQDIVNKHEKNVKDVSRVDVRQHVSKNSNTNAFLVPGFVPKNKVEYDGSGLDIREICIKTMNGEKVNNILTGEYYHFCYKLIFKDDYVDVGFGMQIHTEKGVLVSACGSRMHDVLIKKVEEGGVYDVEWKFECLLLEGTYYINIGANHFRGAEIKYINRISDAFAFKVIMGDPRLYNGLVTLKQAPSFKKCN